MAAVLLVRFALLALAITYVLTQSTLWSPFRVYIARRSPTLILTGLYCAACTGFWVGVALAVIGAYPYETLLDVPAAVEPLAYAFEAGCVSMALGALWSIAYHGNPAWEAEREDVLGDGVSDAAQTTEKGHE